MAKIKIEFTCEIKSALEKCGFRRETLQNGPVASSFEWQLIVFRTFPSSGRRYQNGFVSQMAKLSTFWLQTSDNYVYNTAYNTRISDRNHETIQWG